MSGKGDQSVFNRNRKFRSRRRSKRKFAGNRFVTANKDRVEEEENIAEQTDIASANENQDETISRPMAKIHIYNSYCTDDAPLYLLFLVYDFANFSSS